MSSEREYYWFFAGTHVSESVAARLRAAQHGLWIVAAGFAASVGLAILGVADSIAQVPLLVAALVGWLPLAWVWLEQRVSDDG